MDTFLEELDISDVDSKKNVGSFKRVIAITSQKGGVGKTTTAINVSAFLSNLGYRTVMVDLDPQSNSTIGLGIDYSMIDTSIYDVLVSNENPNNVLRETCYKNLYVLPANWKLSNAEVELRSLNGREFRLRDMLKRIEFDYDFAIIDCAPYLGLLTANAFTATDEIIIPMQCEYYSLEGVGRLFDTIDLIRNKYNAGLKFSGIVCTMYSKTRLANQAIAEIKNNFPGKVFHTIIPKNVRLGEAASFCKPIIAYDPGCRGALAYRNLTIEIIGNGGYHNEEEELSVSRKIRNFWIAGKPPRHAIKEKRSRRNSG